MLIGKNDRHEIANTLTHAAGLLLSVTALAVMLLRASSVWSTVSAAVFGSTLIIMYGSSFAYHVVRPAHLKAALRIMDHCAIYLLIAGTYTCYALLPLRGPWGWSYLGIIWTMALAGVIFKFFHIRRWPRFSLVMYLVMGWIALAALPVLYRTLPPYGFMWLIAGGLTYTLGTVFYASHKIPYHHAIWHLFVLGGSVCHFVSIYAYVL